MPLAEQLITVGAVLAGAAGSYLTTRLSDRDRFKRELRVRWDERRLEAYVAYLDAVKRVFRCADRILNVRFTGDGPIDHDDVLAEMRAAEGDRSRAFEQVMLLGDTATVEAAHELNERLWRLERPARGAEDLTEEEWHTRHNEWVVALNDFHLHARGGLEMMGEIVRRDTAPRPTKRTGSSA